MASKWTPPALVRRDRVALAEWKRVVPELSNRQLAEPLDRSVVAAYCLSWARYVAAMQWVAEHGDVMTIRTDKGEVKSSAVAPKLTVAERSLDRMVKLAGLIGVEPAGRAARAAGTSATPEDAAEPVTVSKADELRARRAARLSNSGAG